jgi:hypothetical protein
VILTYNTNPQEDNALTYVLGIENARLAALTPPLPPITAAQYLTQIIAAALLSYGSQAKDADIATIKAAYQGTSPAKQAAMVAAAIAAAK